jgi:GNAT superfamily N-acetyltransferase
LTASTKLTGFDVIGPTIGSVGTKRPGTDADGDAPLRILPLTPERLPDLAGLFGQGGDPKWCWCASFRIRGRDWTNSTPAENRAVLEAAVDDTARADRAPGLIAYRDGVAVGWTSLGPRSDYERLTTSRVLAPVDERPVWSIVCFVVGRRSRGRGVAAALLDAAIDYAREHGAATLEAYPIELAPGERIASANVYRGTLAMFERAGFSVVARRQANASTAVRPIVRLEL